ncbi:MAG: imidazolonepropionase [Castellaniella sp.]
MTTIWDALLIDARVASMADRQGFGLIDDGAIGIRDGRIAWLGARQALDAVPAALARQVYSWDGRLITPGLIDPHTHVVHAGSRWPEFVHRMDPDAGSRPAPAGSGLMRTVHETRASGADELLAQSLVRARALLAEGVTTLESKTGYGLDLENECKMARVSRALGQSLPLTVVSTFLGAHALAPEFAGRPDDYLVFLCEDVLPVLVKDGLIDAVDIFCDARGFSHAHLRQLHQASSACKLELFVHADQYSAFGAGQLAAALGARAAAHLEHADARTARTMAQAGTVAVLLPGVSWMHRMTARPPVKHFRAHGVPMALATNCNPGSSPCTSPLTIMNMACHLFGLSAPEALAGFTRCAAQALGMQESRGTVAPGKYADLAIWDVSHPAELVAQVGGMPCHAVFKQGRWVHLSHVPQTPPGC